jgi:hypothetical protein
MAIPVNPRRLAVAVDSACEVAAPAFMSQQCRSTTAPRIGPVGDLLSRRNPQE